jgi:hypothetical protein
MPFLAMTSFTYRCPETGFRMQSFASTKSADSVYEGVACVPGWAPGLGLKPSHCVIAGCMTHRDA